MSDKDKKQEKEQNKTKSSTNEKVEVKLVNNESVHNKPTDINQNVGSFGTNVIDPSKQEETFELDVSDKSEKFINIKNKSVPIDFEKFSRTKKNRHTYKPGKNKFAITLDAWLHNRSSCLKIWYLAIAAIVILLAFSISFVVVVTLDANSSLSYGWTNFTWMKNVGIASNVFGYIIMALAVIPLIYLLITVLVGINEVYKSRNYHYFMWGCFIAAAVLLIAFLVLSGIYVGHYNAFTQPSS